MTALFRRIQPFKKFRITAYIIARLLKIPRHLIVRIECWAYIIFVHRCDCGGQFISYRKLQQWLKDKSLSDSKLLHLATTTAVVADYRRRLQKAQKSV
jgi:regulator of sirC expression with transglutaminase-like and TPR domain